MLYLKRINQAKLQEVTMVYIDVLIIIPLYPVAALRDL